MNIKLKYPLILGSKSPRRKELLQQFGIPFSVQDVGINEEVPQGIAFEDAAVYLAEKKAGALYPQLGQELLLTADTIVIAENEMLGKPGNQEESFAMLKKLSGKWHVVITGICILHDGKYYSASDKTRVFFRNLTDQEIVYYISEYHPFDKAGGYGIQEWIGLTGIERIEGSYFNVMGLPVALVYRLLNENGFISIE